MPHGDFNNEVAEASELARALVGDNPCRDTALDRTAGALGVSKWTLHAIYYGRKKTVGHGLLAALRREYLRLCERQIARLEAQLRDAKMRSETDDSFSDLGREAENLVARLKAARQRE